ncbi:MAG: hypothetical protein ABUS79_26565 [Pseudomonadota bacterium]
MRALTVRRVLFAAFALAAAGCGHAHASNFEIDYSPKRGMVSEVAAADEAGPVADAELAKAAPRARTASLDSTAEPRRYKLFLVDLTGRALGVIHGQNVPNDVALEGVLGMDVPF